MNWIEKVDSVLAPLFVIFLISVGTLFVVALIGFVIHTEPVQQLECKDGNVYKISHQYGIKIYDEQDGRTCEVVK